MYVAFEKKHIYYFPITFTSRERAIIIFKNNGLRLQFAHFVLYYLTCTEFLSA